MDPESDYDKSVKIIETAMNNMDYQSLLSAHNIRLDDEVFHRAIYRAALSMLVKHKSNISPSDGGCHVPIIGDHTEFLPGERIIHPDFAATSEIKSIYERSKKPCFDVPVSDNFAMAQFKKNTDYINRKLVQGETSIIGCIDETAVVSKEAIEKIVSGLCGIVDEAANHIIDNSDKIWEENKND